jgi:hypothetical protein
MARSSRGWFVGSSLERSYRNAPKRKLFFVVEALESRVVPSVSYATPDYMRIGGGGGGGATPFAGPGPTGFTPTQLKHAYAFDQITFNNGAVTGDGSGQTIAIVDAFDDPKLVSSTNVAFTSSDLHQFDLQFHLPDPTFTKLDENGGTSYPAANAGWISEIALDVEWAHAMAPGANIVLVEAASASFGDLLTAVQTATNVGASVVSMSWGGGEFGGETSFDSTFQAPGVTYVASSGDSGAPASYPNASPFVISVGGTTLHLDANNNISSETGWSGSGGGLSSQEGEPSYQVGVVPTSITTTQRATPDVAYDADPNTGVPVYDSFNGNTQGNWFQFGGTSIAAPQFSALIAIANQGRALNHLSSLTGSSQTLPMIYSHTSDFHDITSGTSTGSPRENAGPGYDLVTGIGTPIANKLVADLSGQAATPVATHFAVTATPTSTAGNSFTVTVTAEDASNNPVPTYAGTVRFSSSDGQASLPGNFPFPGGTATESFTVTLRTAGNDSISVTDTTSGITGSTTVSVSPAAASQVLFVQQPPNGVVSEALTPAVTAKVVDAFGNIRNGDSVTVSLSPSSGGLGGTLTRTVTGGVATFGDLTVALAGTYTLTATSGGISSSPSSGFTITAPVVTHFRVTGPTGPVTAGTSFQVTVTALDAGNNPVPSYVGSVHFGSTDGQASLPSNFPFPGGTATETFTVTLRTAGSQSVSVNDASQTAVTGSATVTVAPAAASQLEFLQQPQSGTINETLATVKVELLDNFNNVLTNDNTDSVQLALTNPGGATLNGGQAQTVSGGVATFGSLSMNALGTYTLTATSGSLSQASNSFTINAPIATKLVVTGPSGPATAGTAFQVTVTAEDNAGQIATGFGDTVQITTSTSGDLLPPNAHLSKGVGTFAVTSMVAGSDTVTATDTSNGSIHGSAAVTVNPAAASQVVFVQPPTNATAGAAISPAVTVKVVDAFGNVRNGDSVTVSLTGSPSGVTLGGTLTQTVSGGVATFSNLTVSAAGSYTLTATSGSLSQTSSSFTIAAASTANVIEDFESSRLWNIVNGRTPTASRTTAAAHDGTLGLDSRNGNDWYYRSDSAAQVQAGDTLSVWIKFTNAANTRAYFAFGVSSFGTLSLVAAPNTGQFIIQENLFFGFANLSAVSQSYQSNHWYRMEVDWGTSGTIIGKLFDSDGTTLIQTVTAFTTDITSGGFGFRNIGNDTYWDTVTAVHGGNNFKQGSHSGSGPFLAGSLSPGEGARIPSGPTGPAGSTPLERLFATDPATVLSASQYLFRKAGSLSLTGGWEAFFQSLEGSF